MLPADADLDRAVAQLRADPVVVESAMGSGEAEEYHDRLAELVRELPFPTYVLLKDRIADGRTEKLDSYALLLSRRLGPGLYLLGQTSTPLSVTVPGYGQRSYVTYPVQFGAVDSVEKIAAAETGQQVFLLPKVLGAETVLRAAGTAGDPGTWDELEMEAGADLLKPAEREELAERAVAVQTRADFRPVVPRYVSVEWVDPGRSTMRGAWAGAAMSALVLFLGFAPWRRRRSAAPIQVPDPVLEGRLATADVARLAERIDAATATGRLVPSEVLLGLDAARQLAGSELVEDLIGTRVLTADALARLDGKEHRTCFFDPRHGPARGVARWRLGQGQIEVPVCTTCDRAITRGKQPRALHLIRRGRPVAYYERDDVWARTGYGSLVTDLAAEVLADRGRR